jgi:solute carrier family 25 protein 44
MTNKGIQWNDIDKLRFYGIGTVLYSSITIALHPVNVMKTRQQVLENNFKISSGTFVERIRAHYRGIGIILLLAIPARSVYITTLENTKETLSQTFGDSPIVTSISGGVAGGLAAMSSQLLVVPMDIISQKQMVMQDAAFKTEGSAFYIAKSIVRTDGIKGFYRGFGLSLFSSLPVGSLWWASYSGCQHLLKRSPAFQRYETNVNSIETVISKGFSQITSGLGAAIIAATLTQPLDVVKTRLQVGGCLLSDNMNVNKTSDKSYMFIAKELYASSGTYGFFRGLTPRIMSMGLWGTVLSSAYELLRHVSHKDFEFDLGRRATNKI